MSRLLPWVVRLVLLAGATAGFNYWLHTHAPGALASEPNRFAVVFEDNYPGYSGVQGYIYTGSPYPVPAGTLSNQTLGAVDNSACPGELSFVETGWYRITAGYRYKWIFRVPATYNCDYYEVYVPGGPAPNSMHHYRMEYCYTCGGIKAWLLYIDGQFTSGVITGWVDSDFIEAGGEVAGDYIGIGMQGGINSMRFRFVGTWINLNPDGFHCDEGYWLILNGAPYHIFDWGYDLPGGCPDV